jgi:hypothetical protein
MGAPRRIVRGAHGSTARRRSQAARPPDRVWAIVDSGGRIAYTGAATAILGWEGRLSALLIRGFAAWLGVTLLCWILPPAEVRGAPAEVRGAPDGVWGAPDRQAEESGEYMGVSFAITDASGRWVGRWLGAHLYTRDGTTYFVGLSPEPWAQLQQALATTDRAALYVLGDLPYAGDGVCAPGSIRRWWSNGQISPGVQAVSWEPAPVPPSAPALPCPLSILPEGWLVLQPVASPPGP